MNKRIIKIMFIIASLTFLMMISSNTVFAAGSFTVSKSSITITEGKTDKISINGSNATGRVDIKSSNSDIASVSSNNEWLENNSKTITITGKKAGTATISISGTVADEDGKEATISKTVKVTVKEKATTTTDSKNNTSTTKSSNAYLSTLGVTPKEYDFSGFSKTKYEYNVTVPSDVNSLKVVYKTADSKATVNVNGNSGFEVGSNNKITIKVTAEDGKTSKTYQIKVTKLATEEEKPGNLIEEEKNLYLKSLEIEGVNLSPEFSSDIYAYTADIETDITQVKLNAKANNEKAKIEITGNENLVDGENLINVIVIGKDESTKVVYQITLNKAVNTIGSTVNNDQTNQENSDDALKLGKKAVRIIIIVIATIIIFIVIISVLLVKENKRLKKIDEENLFKNNEIQNLNDIPRTEDKDKIYKRGGKH